MGRLGAKRTVDEEVEVEVEEFEVDVVHDELDSSRNSRLALLDRVRRRGAVYGEEGFVHGHIIHPDNRYVLLQLPLPLDALIGYVVAVTKLILVRKRNRSR
jgi:hypothetical protein